VLENVAMDPGHPAVDDSVDAAPDAAGEDVARESFRRRVRALLHTRPLHTLELNKVSRGKGKFEPYDLVTLQLAAIDYLTDNQDPRHGVPVE
jgi:hypothetical protein